MGDHRTFLAGIPAGNHLRTNFPDDNHESVSPVSQLSSDFRTPIDRVVSSYFVSEESYSIDDASNDVGMNPLPFMDLNTNAAEMGMEINYMIDEVVTEYSSGASSQHHADGLRSNPHQGSMYVGNDIGEQAVPFWGISAEEAAFQTSSILTHQEASVTQGSEQSIEERRREERTAQPWLEQPGLEPSTRPRGAGRMCEWLPIALRWWFMASLFLVSLGLGLAAIFLTLYSHNHQGLGIDHNTSTFLFTWKFIPTLAAVVYSLLVMTTINDIKRTEPYARLSRPGGAPAASTLFLKSGSMWSDIFTTLRNSKNGGARNWALFWASFVNLLTILIVVPFSAAFIFPANILVKNTTTFSQLAASVDSPMELSTDDSIFIRTISSVLLNTTTSAWVSNDYAVLPFWPSNENAVPLGGVVSSSSLQWTANTTVYQTDLECSPMGLRSFANFTLNQSLAHLPGITMFSDVNLTSFILESADGCTLGLAGFPPDFSSNTIFKTGGGWWSGAPNFSYPLLWAPGNGTAMDLNFDHPIMLNTSTQCGRRSMYLFATPYIENQTFRAQGQICTSSYFSASLPVTVSNIGTSSTVIFDTQEFENIKVPIPPTTLDIHTFENAFLSQNWSSKLRSPDSSSNPDLPLRPRLGGPLNLLGAQNNFDLQTMLANADLTDQARQIKQRFLGESMMSTFRQIGTQQAKPIIGTTLVSERRIVVSFVVGIILTAALLLSALIILLVAFYTRHHKRPLNLLQDPASPMAMASLINSNPNMQALFEGADRYSEYAMQQKLADHVFYLRNGELYASMKDTYQQSCKSRELRRSGSNY